MLLKPKKISKELGTTFSLERVKSHVWCGKCKYWNWDKEGDQRECKNIFDIKNESIHCRCTRLCLKILGNYLKHIPYTYSYVVKKD